MGLDILFTAGYKLLGGGGSGARKMAKMYADVEEKLGVKISELKGNLETAENFRSQKYNNYLNGGGTAEVKILEDFENAVAVWNNKYNSMLMYMNNGLTVLGIRQSQARQLKEYYNTMADMEERKANG